MNLPRAGYYPLHGPKIPVRGEETSTTTDGVTRMDPSSPRRDDAVDALMSSEPDAPHRSDAEPDPLRTFTSTPVDLDVDEGVWSGARPDHHTR